MNHICDKDERIRKLEERMSIVETKVDEVKQDIKEIKASQNKLLYWVMGTMGTALVTLFTLIVNMMR